MVKGRALGVGLRGGLYFFLRVRKGWSSFRQPCRQRPMGPVGHAPVSCPGRKGAGSEEREAWWTPGVGRGRGGWEGEGGGWGRPDAGGKKDRFDYLQPPRSLFASWAPSRAQSCQGRTRCHSTDGKTEGHQAGGTGLKIYGCACTGQTGQEGGGAPTG